jgi:hypothetical protein
MHDQSVSLEHVERWKCHTPEWEPIEWDLEHFFVSLTTEDDIEVLFLRFRSISPFHPPAAATDMVACPDIPALNDIGRLR